jgi:hypothetical protein
MSKDIKIKVQTMDMEADPVIEKDILVTPELIRDLRALAKQQEKTANIESFINALGVETPTIEDFIYTKDELDDCDVEITEEE